MLELPEELKHIAVIMDGNGRWAKARGLRRTRGHREGVKSVRAITTTCAEAGLQNLTLYALSVENFQKRPRSEIEFLLVLLKKFVLQERSTIMDNNIRFRTIGRTDEFPARVRRELEALRDISANNDGMTLCLALNYGGRSEIVDAVKRISLDVAEGNLNPDDFDEVAMNRYLYDPEMPDVDLMIRTSGHMRISNFLLWQMSYGELYVTEDLWPDFDAEKLKLAVEAFQGRDRKFGGLARKIDA